MQPEFGYDEVCANFNEQYKDKGVQVEYVRYVNNTDGNLQLDNYLMAGGEVDVFMGYGGVAKLNDRVSSNLVLELSDYLEKYNFDLVKELGEINMVNYVRDDGKCYGFPTKYENIIWMLINKDMFDAAGIPIPYDGWTYSEFMDAIEKLTTGEGQDKVYGMCWAFNESWTSSKSLLGSVLAPYATFKDDQGSAVNYDNEVWRQGLEMLKTSIDNGWATPLEDEVTENLKVENYFLEGKCAIELCIAQMRLVMDQEGHPHDFTTALVPAPVPDGEEYNTPFYRTHAHVNGAGDLICISSKTPYPDAAFEFALWYLTGGMAPVAKGGRIPLWTGFDKDSVIKMIQENAGDSIDEQSLRNYLSVDNTQGVKELVIPVADEISTVYREEVEGLLYGQQDVDTTIEHLVTRGNEMIAGAQ